MKIVVNDIAASYGGAMTVLKSFYEYVKYHDSDNEYIFLLSGAYFEETNRIKVILLPEVKKSSIAKLYFDFITGRKLLQELKPDCVLSLQNIITFGYHGVQSVYVHQSIPFQSEKQFSFLKKNERTLAIYQYLIGSIISLSVIKADHVFVQAEWMKKNVAKKCNIPKNRITVIPIAGERKETKMPYSCEQNRFFYPATDDPVYKNHSVIYEAIQILQKDGVTDYRVTLTLDRPNLNIHNVNFCGILSKEDLYKEYSRSILIFPSFIETVGLPLVEAMEIGAFILVANCEYAKEVLDGYKNVAFFDPFSPDELAKCMKKCIDGEFISNGESRIIECCSNDWGTLIQTIVSGV